MLSRKMLNNMGERRHPWLTQTDVWNHCPTSPWTTTALLAFVYSCLTVSVSFLLMLYFTMLLQSASCYTLSNAVWVNENMMYDLLMLTVFPAQDMKVNYLLCGAHFTVKPSLFFSNDFVMFYKMMYVMVELFNWLLFSCCMFFIYTSLFRCS